MSHTTVYHIIERGHGIMCIDGVQPITYGIRSWAQAHANGLESMYGTNHPNRNFNVFSLSQYIDDAIDTLNTEDVTTFTDDNEELGIWELCGGIAW